MPPPPGGTWGGADTDAGMSIGFVLMAGATYKAPAVGWNTGTYIAGPNQTNMIAGATAMLFGLVHGFGFSYGLKEDLQFAGTHLVVSLFAFNVGIEIGQLLVLIVMLPALALVTRFVLPGRVGAIILTPSNEGR